MHTKRRITQLIGSTPNQQYTHDPRRARHVRMVRSAVTLQPPLTMTFKSKRTDDEPRAFFTELVITDHFMVLFDRPG